MSHSNLPMYLQVMERRRCWGSFSSPGYRVLTISGSDSGMTPPSMFQLRGVICPGERFQSIFTDYVLHIASAEGRRSPLVAPAQPLWPRITLSVKMLQVDSNTHVGLLCLCRLLPAVVYTGPCVAGLFPEFLFDLQKAVVFCDALTAADGARLDLAHAGRHGKVGNAGVIGLARTMRDDRAIPVLTSNLNAFERFRHRADLIQLDQNGVGDAVFDALTKDCGIGDKIVVADQLYPASKGFGQLLPAGAIVFGNPSSMPHISGYLSSKFFQKSTICSGDFLLLSDFSKT